MKLFSKLNIGKKNFLFLLIIFIAIFLRLNNLLTVPPSASLDEASIGYNAYSILKTSTDEYGTKFPILLRAYDDWRPALYVYFVIPFIKIFGLNVFAVRFPSVILSVLTVFSTYFLVKNLFDFFKYKIPLALSSSFLLAISPWHIYISRLGHEVNAGLALIIFAITFFIYAVKRQGKSWMIILSLGFFILSFYTYQSLKVFAPFMLIALLYFFRKELFEIKKKLFFSFILGLLLIIPIALATVNPQALIRFKGTSAFSQGNSLYQQSAEKIFYYKEHGNILGQFYYNRRFVPVRVFVGNYLSHFNPSFLFFNSGNDSFKAPGFGLLYIWELPLLITGILYLAFAKVEAKVKKVIICWLAISFIAPSLTTGAPHAMRAYGVLPIPQILTSLGIVWIFNYIYKIGKWITFVFSFIIFIIISLYTLYFYNQYFFVFPKAQSSSFQYSLSLAMSFVSRNDKQYSKIIFSNRDKLYQSYMFFLFYRKYDPLIYQKQGGSVSGGFEETHEFAKYEFRPIVWDKDQFMPNTLFIGNISDFSPNAKAIRVFKNLNDKEEIKIVEG